MFEKTISYRRKKFKDARKQHFKSRQDRLKNQSEQLAVTEFLPNDKESVMGVSHNFSSPILTTNLTADAGLYNDEPTRIRSLTIKGKYQPLSQKEKDQLQRYYYMQDNLQEKDNRFLLGEGYKVSKKLLGLNGRAQVATN